MTVSGPGTPEPRSSHPRVCTDSPVAFPLRTCALPPGHGHLILAFPGTRPGLGSSPSSAALPTAFLSTGQLSRAAADRGQRALQMRGLRGSPDCLHPGPESRPDAPGPGHSAPKPGCLPPQAGEGGRVALTWFYLGLGLPVAAAVCALAEHFLVTAVARGLWTSVVGDHWVAQVASGCYSIGSSQTLDLSLTGRLQ